MKSSLKYLPLICAALTIIISVPLSVTAQPVQQFTVNYDASLALDPKRASNKGLSQSMINVLTSIMGSAMSIADIKDTVTFSKDTYHIQSVGTLGRILSAFMPKGTFVRVSDGQILGSTINTLRYVDIRTSNPPLTTLVDAKNKSILFYNGKTFVNSTPYKYKLHDALSLGYAFIGKLPTQALSVAMSDGKSIKQAIFDVRKEPLKLSTGQWDSIKLTRRVVNKDDASVEYWLRASDGLPLRVRIGMSQRYGAVLDLTATKIPTKVQPF